MELDLDFLEVGGVVRGRDLASTDLENGAGSTGPIKRLRERHHALAREVAGGGKSDKQIAIEQGYTPATLTRLRSDPSFIELVDFYARGYDADKKDMLDRLTALGEEATDELRERLETKPDEFSNGQLMELTKLASDRTGFGPSSKSEVNVNVGFGARLSAAAEREKLIDVTPNKDAAE